jgi:hypothetical protein
MPTAKPMKSKPKRERKRVTKEVVGNKLQAQYSGADAEPLFSKYT